MQWGEWPTKPHCGGHSCDQSSLLSWAPYERVSTQRYRVNRKHHEWMMWGWRSLAGIRQRDTTLQVEGPDATEGGSLRQQAISLLAPSDSGCYLIRPSISSILTHDMHRHLLNSDCVFPVGCVERVALYIFAFVHYITLYFIRGATHKWERQQQPLDAHFECRRTMEWSK